MALFNTSQQQMVLDLLISENPGLAGATLNNVEFIGMPTGSSPVTVTLRGKAGSGFTGVKKFTYNRIHLGTLFINTVLSIQQFTASTAQDLIPAINEKYGLNLVPSDMVAYGIPAGSNSGNITIATGSNTSLVYYGAVNCVWTRGSKQISDFYLNRTLTALTPPELMMKAFQLDFSDTLSVLQAHNTMVAFTTTSSTAQAIVDALKAKVGLPLTLGATTTPGTGQYDLSGFTLSFTTPDVLQDSNPRYRQIAVLTPPAVYGNQYAPIYLHFDPVTVTELSGLITHPDLNGFSVS